MKDLRQKHLAPANLFNLCACAFKKICGSQRNLREKKLQQPITFDVHFELILGVKSS